MKISTKGRYALEIVTDLAIHSDQEHPESLKNIAARRKVSEKYIERIVKALREAGIVCSIRGAKGGYCLAVQEDRLTVYEVLLASEGTLVPVDCLIQDPDCGIDPGKCLTRSVWKEMWNAITDTADEITVGQLVKEISMQSKVAIDNVVDK